MSARRLYPRLLAIVVGLAWAIEAAGAGSDHACALPSRHAGVSFPVEQVATSWTCRLQPIMTDYTTANRIGPVRTPLPEDVYFYLMDHPSTAAALVNRLDLGLYKAVMESPGRFWASDGEGTEGLVQLVYEDRTTRIYYLEGSHDGTLLPQVTGKAVVLLMIRPVRELQGAGMGMMDTTVVSYAKLDSRILSGIMSLLRPLLGRVVTRQFMKGFETVDRLSQIMRNDPERVLFEATDPPSLPDAEVALLKQALSILRNPGGPTNPASTLR